eukprot:1140235-Pelagomonas_calceolata.AAC.2
MSVPLNARIPVTDRFWIHIPTSPFYSVAFWWRRLTEVASITWQLFFVALGARNRRAEVEKYFVNA